jgi:uncharacterized YccA/Bax inhibitor family protein
MSNQDPSKSFMDKFGPQGSGQMSGSSQNNWYSGQQQSSQYSSQYSQPSKQQPVYQQPVYQQQYQAAGAPRPGSTSRTIAYVCLLCTLLLGAAVVYLTKNPNPKLASMENTLATAGAIMWLATWAFWSRSKGYWPILGLLSLSGIGVIFLLLLPNKYKQR